eukprot:7083359-Pyramimonas_sp.AAC.1
MTFSQKTMKLKTWPKQWATQRGPLQGATRTTPARPSPLSWTSLTLRTPSSTLLAQSRKTWMFPQVEESSTMLELSAGGKAAIRSMALRKPGELEGLNPFRGP